MMYQSFYGMRKPPFSLLPDPAFFFPDGPYEAALAYLEYGLLSQKGFILLTGEPGLGKTTLLRKIIREKKSGVPVGEILNTNSTWASVLSWVTMAFNLSPLSNNPSDHYQAVVQFLRKSPHGDHPALLIIDEAQNLTPPMLEELRLLSNLNLEGIPNLQIILSGQPQLRNLIQQPDLVQFAQRIEVDCHLQALDRTMTQRYIQHRLKCAGPKWDLFTTGACSLIYDLSRGIPRLINQLCDLGLTYGFAKESPKISDQVVAEAALDRLLGGVLPIDHTVQIQAVLSRNTPDPELTGKSEAEGNEIQKQEYSPKVVDNNGNPKHKETAPYEELEKRPVTVTPSGSADVPSRTHPDPNSPNPERARKMLEQGIALRNKQKYKTAIQVLTLASQQASVRGEAQREIGVCFMEAGKTERAIPHFQKALAWTSSTSDREEDNLALRYELGRALYASGQVSRALEQFTLIEHLQPGYRDVPKWLKKDSGVSSKVRSIPQEQIGNKDTFWKRWLKIFSFSGVSQSTTSRDSVRRKGGK